jgi:hypothetical protein
LENLFGKLRQQFVFRHLDFVLVFKKLKRSTKKISAKFVKKSTLKNLFGKFFQKLNLVLVTSSPWVRIEVGFLICCFF